MAYSGPVADPVVANAAGAEPGAASVLSGMRVLELAAMVAGPYCTKILGDLGADVIKIEPPEGDESRRAGPFAGGRPGPDRSLLFLHLNTSKRSCCIDMSTPEGIERFVGLAAQSEAMQPIRL